MMLQTETGPKPLAKVMAETMLKYGHDDFADWEPYYNDDGPSLPSERRYSFGAATVAGGEPIGMVAIERLRRGQLLRLFRDGKEASTLAMDFVGCVKVKVGTEGETALIGEAFKIAYESMRRELCDPTE